MWLLCRMDGMADWTIDERVDGIDRKMFGWTINK